MTAATGDGEAAKGIVAGLARSYSLLWTAQFRHMVHTSSYDEARRTATFFATYHAVHSGDGGPVPPTHKQTHSHYVYALTMSANGKVEHMVKIWNAGWAMRELGWT